MRFCSKTACAGEAAASYAFSYEARVVWLAALTLDPHPAFYDLCEQHARTLRVPKGWEMEDLRSDGDGGDPALPEVPAPMPAPTPDPAPDPAPDQARDEVGTPAPADAMTSDGAQNDAVQDPASGPVAQAAQPRAAALGQAALLL
jgi:hypothetical protein